MKSSIPAAFVQSFFSHMVSYLSYGDCKNTILESKLEK